MSKRLSWRRDICALCRLDFVAQRVMDAGVQAQLSYLGPLTEKRDHPRLVSRNEFSVEIMKNGLIAPKIFRCAADFCLRRRAIKRAQGPTPDHPDRESSQERAKERSS